MSIEDQLEIERFRTQELLRAVSEVTGTPREKLNFVNDVKIAIIRAMERARTNDRPGEDTYL